LPNTGEIFAAGEKSSTPLPIQARQHRDDYQASLNSPLILLGKSPQGANSKPAVVRGRWKFRTADDRNDESSRHSSRAKQSIVSGPDRCAAFATGLAEAIQVGDLDVWQNRIARPIWRE
jgi:hypothetical protein